MSEICGKLVALTALVEPIEVGDTADGTVPNGMCKVELAVLVEQQTALVSPIVLNVLFIPELEVVLGSTPVMPVGVELFVILLTLLLLLATAIFALLLDVLLVLPVTPPTLPPESGSFSSFNHFEISD